MGQIIIETKNGIPVKATLNAQSVREQILVLRLLNRLLPWLAELRKEAEDESALEEQ